MNEDSSTLSSDDSLRFLSEESFNISPYAATPRSGGTDQSSFETALKFTLREEGGQSDHPSDRGGKTNRGVTQTTLAEYRKLDSSFPTDVSQLTEVHAKQIYHVLYWQRVKGDHLPPALAVATFDAAVHSGVSRATKWLQEAVGVTQDGIIGQATIEAAKHSDPIPTIEKLIAIRLKFLVFLPQAHTFTGWFNRIIRLTSLCIRTAVDAT